MKALLLENIHPSAVARLEDAGFEVDEAEVVFWGRCPACGEGRMFSSARCSVKRIEVYWLPASEWWTSRPGSTG